jgi:SAM-dependent methyltransferase
MPLSRKKGEMETPRHSDFPPPFDYDFYVRRYTDLGELTREQARVFFESQGKAQGHHGSHLCDFNRFIHHVRELPHSAVLEIGPGSKPKLAGPTVRYFDVRTAEQLRQWAVDHQLPTSDIPAEIHYVHESGRMTDIEERFDIVFSSHNIEHQINVVRHINEVSTLLKPNGLFCLGVPDKRFTFDHFRPLTSIGSVLEEYFDDQQIRASNPPLREIINHVHYAAHNDTKRHWAGDHGELRHPLSELMGKILSSQRSILEERYIDIHHYVFTSDTFHEVFDALFLLGITQLELHRCYNTPYNSNTFCAVFRKPTE